MGSELKWVRDSEVRRTLQKTAEQWQTLKKTIDLVSDSLTEDVEMEGTLVAANAKTRAFVLQSGPDYISPSLPGASSLKAQSRRRAKDYRFSLKKPCGAIMQPTG